MNRSCDEEEGAILLQPIITYSLKKCLSIRHKRNIALGISDTTVSIDLLLLLRNFDKRYIVFVELNL